MPVCPVCGHENIYGALVCAKCYNLLTRVSGKEKDSTLPSATSVFGEKPTPSRRAVDTSSLSVGSIALYFDQLDKTLVVQVGERLTLGRNGTTSPLRSLIDLTPFGALDKGVSREHAVIRSAEKSLTIQDMSSRNGTWLNSTRLTPYTPVPLKSRDHVLLGDLLFSVHFRLE